MRFFNFVKEHNRVRSFSDEFGQLPTAFKADISWRGANQPVDAGGSAKYQHSLESGNYDIYCYRDGTYVIHGDNLFVR